MSPPAVVAWIIGPAVGIMEIEIASVGTVLTHISALFIPFGIFVNSFPVQPLIKGTAMVEYTVYNNVHPPFMGFLHHPDKQFVACFQIGIIRHPVHIFCGKPIFPLPRRQQLPLFLHNFTEMRVNIIIILNIIFMVGRRNKQGIKIDNLHAQLLQIVHLIQYSLQVTAIKIPDIHPGRIPVPVLYLLDRLADIAVFRGLYIIGSIAVTESVHINLVHHGTLCPFRGMETGDYHKVIIFIDRFHNTSRVIKTLQPARLYLEMIAYLRVLQRKFDIVKIKMLILRIFLGHNIAFISAYQTYPVYIISPRPEPHL